MMTYDDLMEDAVSDIRDCLDKGDRKAALEVVQDLARKIPFPRVQAVIDEYNDPSFTKWLWGQWGPEHDLVMQAVNTVENSFLHNAGMLMSTKGVHEGRQIAAQEAGIKGAYYSAAVEEDGCCDLCASLDGRECAYPSDEYDTYDPPQHCNCQCVWLYIGDEQTDFQPDADWASAIEQSEYNTDGLTADELLFKHGHSNAYVESSRAKGESEMIVSARVLQREWLNGLETYMDDSQN
jgi:hypothetical protein